MDFEKVIGLTLQVVGMTASATLFVWLGIKAYVKKAVADECDDRKTADKNIEGVVERNAQLLHNYMGKFDLQEQRIHEGEMIRLREMHELKLALEQGLNAIKIELERLRR